MAALVFGFERRLTSTAWLVWVLSGPVLVRALGEVWGAQAVAV